MTIQRRGFLAAMLAAAAAPAIVKAESLMKLYVPPREVWTPYGYDLGAGDSTVESWLEADGWHHVAVTRSGGDLKTYVDGQLVTNNHPLRRALKDATHGIRLPMDELRITRGVARYDGSFQPPRYAFP